MLNGYGESSSIAIYGPTVLRVVLAAVFIAHGSQKLFGLWGGGGLSRTAASLTGLGIEPSYWLAAAAGTVEFGGGLLLLLGAYTVVAAGALAVERAASAWFVHAPSGFFLPSGIEYDLVLLGALAGLALTGAGALSLDARRASHAAAAAAGRARLRAGKV